MQAIMNAEPDANSCCLVEESVGNVRDGLLCVDDASAGDCDVLGLALKAESPSMMRAVIQAASTLNRGASFWIRRRAISA